MSAPLSEPIQILNIILPATIVYEVKYRASNGLKFDSFVWKLSAEELNISALHGILFILMESRRSINLFCI